MDLANTHHALGRTVKLTEANGCVTYTVYNDAAHETRTYRGWHQDGGGHWQTAGPVEVSRWQAVEPVQVDGQTVHAYSESFTYSWNDPDGFAADYRDTTDNRPLGNEPLSGTGSYAVVQSLSRALSNSGGQTIASRQYFSLTDGGSGTLAYSPELSLGGAGTNYLETTYFYDAVGRPYSIHNADGTVDHTFYDTLGRVTSQWRGTDDVPNGDLPTEYRFPRQENDPSPFPDPRDFHVWAMLNPSATQVTAYGLDMYKVSAYVYDAGGVGDGNLTDERTWFTSTADDYAATTYEYDWLDRLTKTVAPDPDGAADPTLSSPETEYAYNWLGQTVRVIDPLDGVTEYAYDARGRQYRVTLPDPDPTNGVTTDRPVSNYWYDAAGNLVTAEDALDRVTTYEYDGLGRLVKTTLPDPDGTGGTGVSPVYETVYDAAGSLWKKIDPLLNVTEYAYDLLGRLLTRTDEDPDGSGGALPHPVTEYVYGPAGNLSEVHAPGPNGERVTKYEYDLLGRQTKTTLPDPDGSGGTGVSPVYETLYDAAGRLWKEIDPLGSITEYQYDFLGRLVTVVSPDPDPENQTTADQPVTHYAYNLAGLLVAATDPLGRVTTYEYDRLARLLKTTLPDPDPTNQTTDDQPVYETRYDAAGNVVQEIDPLGNVTTYEYDHLGRLTKTTAPDPDPSNQTTDDQPVTEYVYDAAGQLITVIDPLDRETVYDYDDLGRQVTVTLPDPDPNVSNDQPVYHTHYDAAGNVVEEIDALGRVTSYQYDHLGRLVTITQPDPDPNDADPGRPQTDYRYNEAGEMIEETVLIRMDGSTPVTSTTTYGYDDLGRQTKVIGPNPDTGVRDDDFTYETRYDAAGNVVLEIDPLGNETEYEYDHLGRLVTVTGEDPATQGGAGGPVTEYEYNVAGELVLVTDPLEQQTAYVYDDLGRQTKTILPDPLDGSPDGPVYETVYNAAGSVVREIDPRGQATDYGYDNLYRLTDRYDPDPDEPGSGLERPHTEYAYNVVGAMTALVDPAGNTTHWEYDGLDRVEEEWIGAGGTGEVRSFGYDVGGNLTQKTDRNGRVSEFDYDALGRMTAERWMDGQTAVHTIAFDYDLATQMKSADAEDDTSTVYSHYGYGYDLAGQLTGVAAAHLGVALTLAHGYNTAGLRTSTAATTLVGQTETDDFVNAYSYDNLARLKRVEQDDRGEAAVAEKRVDLAYDLAGQFQSIDRYKDLDGGAGNEVATGTYTFDHAGRLTDLDYTHGQTSIVSHGWTFDAAARITQYANSIDGTVDYTNDNTDQLTAADYSNPRPDEAYTYDENGNRVTANGATYTTDDYSRVLSDGTFRYSYDAEGNLAYKWVDADSSGTLNAGDTNVVHYTWDHRNRLANVTRQATHGGAATWAVDFIYDAFNRRVASLYDNDADGDSERTEYYLYDGTDVCLDFLDADGDGGTYSPVLNKRYLWNPAAVDQLLAQENDFGGGQTQALWALTDHLGTVRDLIGGIDIHYVYSAFGQRQWTSIVIHDGCLTDEVWPRYGFTAQEHEWRTEFIYCDGRFLDPRTGRFASEDPKGLGPDVNPYRYVNNGPVNASDPTGLESPPFPPLSSNVASREAVANLPLLAYPDDPASDGPMSPGRLPDSSYDYRPIEHDLGVERIQQAWEREKAERRRTDLGVAICMLSGGRVLSNSGTISHSTPRGYYHEMKDGRVLHDGKEVLCQTVCDTLWSEYDREVERGEHGLIKRGLMGALRIVAPESDPLVVVTYSDGSSVRLMGGGAAQLAMAGQATVLIGPVVALSRNGVKAAATELLTSSAYDALDAGTGLPVSLLRLRSASAGTAAAEAAASRRAYLNAKFGRSGNLNADINARGIDNAIQVNAELAADYARLDQALSRIRNTPQAFGDRAHEYFETLNNRTMNRVAGTCRVATEQYRNPLGRIVAPHSADSIGADVLYTPWGSSAPITIYDLKTFSAVPRPIRPARQTEFRIRFGAPAQEIFVPQ